MDELIGESVVKRDMEGRAPACATSVQTDIGTSFPRRTYPSSVVGPEITKLPGPGLTGSAGTSKTKRRGREWNDVKVVSRRAS